MSSNSLRILTDRDQFRLPDDSVSNEGYITVSARIARIGVQTYYGHELTGVDGAESERLYKVYRAEAQVFSDEALASFEGLPITLGHPADEVSAENYRDLAVGHIIGQPVRDGDFVRAQLTIRDAKAIAKIKSGEAAQISVGYFADVHLEPGTAPDGEGYDAIQSHIRGNHIALVDTARCGPQCKIEGKIEGKIGDSKSMSCVCPSCQENSKYVYKENNMTEFVTIDGEQIPLAQAVEKLRDANARMAEALKDAQATIEGLTGELETKKGEVQAMKQVPTGDVDFTAKVQARAKMLSEASAILGDGAALALMTDGDIRCRVINHIYGDDFASGATEHALIGMYKVAVRDAQKTTDNLNGQVSPTSSTLTHLQAALTRRNDRLSSAWKGEA